MLESCDRAGACIQVSITQCHLSLVSASCPAASLAIVAKKRAEFSASNLPTLLRQVLRDSVFIFGSSKVSPVNHCDPAARPDRLNTDDVIPVDVGIVWRSFDKYKFGHELLSRLGSYQSSEFESPIVRTTIRRTSGAA